MKISKLSYFVGFATASLLFLTLVAFAVQRKGVGPVLELIAPERTLTLPRDVVRELTAMRAVVGNANNPTRQPDHDTIMVEPDSELGYVLRPDVRITVHKVHARNALNFDPPCVYLPEGAPVPPATQAYLDRHTRLRYRYTTDAARNRTTLPVAQADTRVLIVGDSVAFGVGVNDHQTMASCLQSMLDPTRIQVVNAGVGGYDGMESCAMARRQAALTNYAALVYIACQNDFKEGKRYMDIAGPVLQAFKEVAPLFNNNVCVCLVPYLEYTARDVFKERGWPVRVQARIDALRTDLPDLARSLGFVYFDWTDTVEKTVQAELSVLAGFGLYADHCHLSPRGNALMAAVLRDTLKTFNLIGTGDELPANLIP